MNTGKRFEQNFKKSVPADVFYYRFKDGTSNWEHNGIARFQATNICDCMLFDGNRLYLLELKSVKGKSIPFSNLKRNNKDKRLEELLLTTYFKNIVAGIIIEFSTLDRAFFMHINDITDFIRASDRKSIPLDYFVEKGIEIEIIKKRVNNGFNVKKLLSEIGD